MIKWLRRKLRVPLTREQKATLVQAAKVKQEPVEMWAIEVLLAEARSILVIEERRKIGESSRIQALLATDEAEEATSGVPVPHTCEHHSASSMCLHRLNRGPCPWNRYRAHECHLFTPRVRS